jgi:hypothetical protein
MSGRSVCLVLLGSKSVFSSFLSLSLQTRVEPPGSIAWALGSMSEILWSAPVDPAAATALRRAIWHPVLDLLAHSAEGGSFTY